MVQRVDNAVDDFLDQDLVVALAHHPDHRLGAGRTNDQAALGPSRCSASAMAERTLACSSGLPF